MNGALVQGGLLALCPQSLPDGWPVAAPTRTNGTAHFTLCKSMSGGGESVAFPTAATYPVVSINGPLLCGQEGLVPFRDRRSHAASRRLFFFSPACSNRIQSD